MVNFTQSDALLLRILYSCVIPLTPTLIFDILDAALPHAI